MGKCEKVKLTILKGDSENSMIFIMNETIKGQSAYFRAKTIDNFCKRETKVLEMAVEQHIRAILRQNKIVLEDGSNRAIEKALIQLENLQSGGKAINIIDRYCDIENEVIVGESEDGTITVVDENGVLSAALEVEVVDL